MFMASRPAGLRILEVAPSVFSPPKLSSGIKSYTLTLRRYLKRKRALVHVLGASLDGGSDAETFLVRIPFKSDVLYSLYVIPRYLKIRNRYDLIHISDPFLTLPLLLYMTGKPSVITLHEVWSEAVSYKRGLLPALAARIVEHLTLMQATQVIAVDGKIEAAYVRKYPWLWSKVSTVDVGVDLTVFQPTPGNVRSRFGFTASDKIILYLGRFEKEKNVAFLIQAFSHVKRKEPAAKLVLVGSGKEKRNLESLIRELDIRDVIFLDPLAQESVPLILNCADVIALASHYESCPLVAQEALACGLPVVSVDVGRVRELVCSELAGAVVSRDPHAFADALVSFLGRDRRSVQAACRRCVADFSFEKTVSETLAVYKKALSGFPR